MVIWCSEDGGESRLSEEEVSSGLVSVNCTIVLGNLDFGGVRMGASSPDSPATSPMFSRTISSAKSQPAAPASELTSTSWPLALKSQRLLLASAESMLGGFDSEREVILEKADFCKVAEGARRVNGGGLLSFCGSQVSSDTSESDLRGQEVVSVV